MSGPTLQR